MFVSDYTHQCAYGMASESSLQNAATTSGRGSPCAQQCTINCPRLMSTGHSQRHDLVFSTPALPKHPRTISCMHLVLSTLSLLLPYLIPNPFSHEYRLQKSYASPSESKLVPMAGTMTFSVGFSTKPLTDFSNAVTREGHGVRQGAAAPILTLTAARTF